MQGSELTLKNKSLTLLPILLTLSILLGVGLAHFPHLTVLSGLLIFSLLLLLLLDLKTALLILILLRINLDAFHNQINASLGRIETLSLPSVIGILVLSLGILHIIVTKVPFWRYPLVKPFGLFFLGCLLSLSFSENLTKGIIEIAELTSFVILFILVVDTLRSERDIKRMVNVLLISSLVPLFVGLIQIQSNFSLAAFDFEPSFRVYSTLTHPNAYAFYLVMITVLSVSLLLQKTSEAKKLFLRFLFPLLVFSLIFTYTRGAWIGLVIAVFAMGVLKKRKLLIFAPLALYGVILIFPLISQRFESILNPDLFRYDSLAWRLRLWGTSIPYFLSHPVFGNGLGTFQFIAYQVDDWFAAAHNDYLRMLVETGLVGFIGYVILMFSLLKLSFKTRQKAVDSFHKHIALGFSCFLIAYAAMSVADNLFNHGGIQWYFWAYAGVVTAIYRLNTKEKDKKECQDSPKY